MARSAPAAASAPEVSSSPPPARPSRFEVAEAQLPIPMLPMLAPLLDRPNMPPRPPLDWPLKPSSHAKMSIGLEPVAALAVGSAALSACIAVWLALTASVSP
ncbi:hypothetical protein O983_15690 [Mycobacterium avium 09-5983]|nr:hypothetical protein O983_15690 [Mycobacterium avium 09-5983]